MTKVYFLLVVLFCFSFSMEAQFETSKRKIKIGAIPQKQSPKKADSPDIIPSKPNEIKFESKIFSNNNDKLYKGVSTVPKVELPNTAPTPARNPAEIYTDKYNEQLKEDGIKPELFNRDMNLGSFDVYTKEINLSSRDFGVIDGDLVRVWVNGEIVNPRIFLESKYKTMTLTLKKGLNIVEIEALNYGELSPNTGQFMFVDANKELITTQYWNLGIGYKAKLIFNYKEQILKKADEK